MPLFTRLRPRLYVARPSAVKASGDGEVRVRRRAAGGSFIAASPCDKLSARKSRRRLSMRRGTRGSPLRTHGTRIRCQYHAQLGFSLAFASWISSFPASPASARTFKAYRLQLVTNSTTCQAVRVFHRATWLRVVFSGVAISDWRSVRVCEDHVWQRSATARNAAPELRARDPCGATRGEGQVELICPEFNHGPSCGGVRASTKRQ